MKKKKKKKGFIFYTVLIIALLIVSITMSVTMMNTAHAKEIINDKNRNQAYYLANSGLELAYAAINAKSPQLGNLSAMEVAKIDTGYTGGGYEAGFIFKNNAEKKNGKKNILSLVGSASDNYFAVSKDGTVTSDPDKIMGYIKVKGDLLVNPKDVIYFRIVCTSKLTTADTESFPSDTQTLTMIVYQNDPNNPKIYNGDKTSLNE